MSGDRECCALAKGEGLTFTHEADRQTSRPACRWFLDRGTGHGRWSLPVVAGPILLTAALGRCLLYSVYNISTVGGLASNP